jgi:hypothetical protein
MEVVKNNSRNKAMLYKSYRSTGPTKQTQKLILEEEIVIDSDVYRSYNTSVQIVGLDELYLASLCCFAPQGKDRPAM